MRTSRNVVRPPLLASILVAATAAAGLVTAAPASANEIPNGVPERVILNPTQDPATSQIVTWRSVDLTSDQPGKVELRSPDGSVQTVDGAVTKKLHTKADGLTTYNEGEATQTAVTYSSTLTGLAPATQYAYRVLTGDQASEWYSFSTAAGTDEPFTFTWYGDGQNDLTEKWTPIVALANTAFPNSELTLQTGDLINYSEESEWNEWFTITDGQRQTENWLPAIGNHEYSRDAASNHWDANFTTAHNGPQADPAAPGTVQPYQELIANHLKNRTYFTDYQGVRLITLNSQLVAQNALQEQQGVTLPALSNDEFRAIYLDLQKNWLDSVLTDSSANWNIVQFHHPTLSVSEGRNNPLQREAFLPLFKKHNVDLVLSGHDHTYARGFLDSDATGTQGVTSGPVFAVSNSGPKYYNLASDETNVWTQNGATQVIKHERTSLVTGLRITPTTLEFEAIVAQKGEGSSAAALELGQTADSFTITQNNNGSKSVTGGIERRVATGLAGEAGEPVDGDITIEATVPELATQTGALTLTINGERNLNLGEGRNGGDRWSFAATMPTVSVSDTRTEAAGWSVTGGATGLTGTGGNLEAGYLGWYPRVLNGATAQAGKPVQGLLRGGSGLAGSHLLGSANDHSRWGTTQIAADLALDLPIDVQNGRYNGAISVTLFPVD